MKCVIQRVDNCRVDVDGAFYSQIGKGLLILFGVEKGDVEDSITWLADKSCNLRIFSDDNGKMSLSVADIGGEVMIVSQFTLAGTLKKGRRPDFTSAMEPETAEKFYEQFVSECKKILGDEKVKTGVFGASMKVHLVNNGPVTIILEHPIKK
ncbi:D-tyrosyl-tRNA(Tyr) deacylase [Deferribacter autotrophicus]|uniref:D-aminoacyl-tRNA deacylase n=1 Tax=Deferribacter autotrophicus TaxID=500465 RepID=A0A5A8F7K5_9BACT|nr:D-aminoacyl-tRNA deacylase [Deferribacter autotrophicus]KAA0258127.1 D-tyrosyl-tRNA(Tyr) deacylase [Deferribacter autotrophicus]